MQQRYAALFAGNQALGAISESSHLPDHHDVSTGLNLFVLGGS
tara:strand:+ start:1235 stop:1363 length:129 start_codon:yes stop_codon:yes gene_type:complete